MKNEPPTSPSQSLALERFALMAKIQDLLRQGFPLSVALEQVCLCPLTLPNGLPTKLYTDQGKPFTNDHTRVVCARLGVRLLHAKPYHAWSKGKAERVLFTIQQDFEAGLRLPGQAANNLEELNAKFSVWLQSVYHVRVHSSTGMTPTERYQRGAHLVKALDPHTDLDHLFYHQVTRTVRRDGTIRLGNTLYEIDLSLRTLEVQLRFNPFKLDRIEVTHRAVSFGLAKPVNLHLNSQIQTTASYEKRPQS